MCIVNEELVDLEMNKLKFIISYQRTVALRLLKKNFSTKEIAKILGCPIMRVAAWKAWRTMGRY